MAKSLKDFVSEAKSRIQEVNVDETAKQLQNNPNTLILDVREPAEYGQGHIPGALHIPRGMLEAKADLEFAGREPRLSDRHQPIIVHCASGVRSAFAADVLQQMGFTNVKSLAGGFTAWQQSGKPVDQ
jgi:rhodanese-related sulfurtransferase